MDAIIGMLFVNVRAAYLCKGGWLNSKVFRVCNRINSFQLRPEKGLKQAGRECTKALKEWTQKVELVVMLIEL